MDESQKIIRISRLKLQNIAPSNHYKPVTQRNNIFFRIKRNTAVLSRIDNQEDKSDIGSQQYDFNQQSRAISINQKHSIKQLQESRKSGLTKHSIASQSSLKKKRLKQVFPEIRKSKQIVLVQNQKSLGYDDSKNSSKNEIQGTIIGVLSTKQILKKYEIKKMRQQMKKKQFLEDHIKNLKNEDYDIDQDNNESQHSIIGRSLQLRRDLGVQNRCISLSDRQNRLVELLQNRLSDRDYIEYNVRLFQKRDINKKRYFGRYHNILKKQRQQISQQQQE